MGGVVDFGGSKFSKVISTEPCFSIGSIKRELEASSRLFFVKGVTGETKANLITSCLSKCFQSGENVVALTFDCCQANFSMANVFGCDFNNLKTTFKHPESNRVVAVFFYPCHMIKLIGNTFESKPIIFNFTQVARQ